MSKIKLGNLTTNSFETIIGTRQGDCTAPTLFSIYINQLLEEISLSEGGVKFGHLDVSILAFADDIVLISDTPEKLQRLLEILEKWTRNWRLHVNINKTKIMQVRPQNMPRTEFTFRFHDSKLDCVTEYKYLGVYIDEHLTYNKAFEILNKSAQRALGECVKKFNQATDMTCDVYTLLYNSYVAPVLDYGSSVYTVGKTSEYDKVQNSAIRYYLGVNKFIPICAFQLDMMWLNTREGWKIKKCLRKG